jgi:hypothetical protein
VSGRVAIWWSPCDEIRMSVGVLQSRKNPPVVTNISSYASLEKRSPPSLSSSISVKGTLHTSSAASPALELELDSGGAGGAKPLTAPSPAGRSPTCRPLTLLVHGTLTRGLGWGEGVVGCRFQLRIMNVVKCTTGLQLRRYLETCQKARP